MGAGKWGEFAFLIRTIDPKYTVLIAINGHRTAMLVKLLVERLHISLGGLGGRKTQG